MLKYKIENEEDLFCRESITRIDRADIQRLIILAKAYSRERIRWCSHYDTDGTLHEMLIVPSKNTCVKPYKNLGNLEDIASAVMFLCSQAADFITGQIPVVDGGLSLHEAASLSRLSNNLDDIPSKYRKTLSDHVDD
jgi:hypothetical protein